MKATQLSSKPKKEWVGTYVYVAFRPDKIGKIVAVSQKKDDFGSWTFATIKWPDGTQNDEDVHNLQMIEALIADHEKKLTNHKKRLAKAKEILK
jgi:hypothetical protein